MVNREDCRTNSTTACGDFPDLGAIEDQHASFTACLLLCYGDHAAGLGWRGRPGLGRIGAVRVPGGQGRLVGAAIRPCRRQLGWPRWDSGTGRGTVAAAGCGPAAADRPEGGRILPGAARRPWPRGFPFDYRSGCGRQSRPVRRATNQGMAPRWREPLGGRCAAGQGPLLGLPHARRGRSPVPPRPAARRRNLHPCDRVHRPVDEHDRRRMEAEADPRKS